MSISNPQAWCSISKQRLKNLRNDWLLHRYLAKTTPTHEQLLADLQARLKRVSGAKNLLCIVAFEQDQIIDLCLSSLRLFLRNATVAVFDNSSSERGRTQIKKVCAQHQIPYLALPAQSTTHANRSHGLAMSWIYQQVIKELNPDAFGFIDHDLIALSPVDPFSSLVSQPVYGSLNRGSNAWNLWAGYCFYRSAELLDKEVNFLYDFSRELDTGGRNWATLYQFIDKDRLTFAPDGIDSHLGLPDVTHPVQLIDKNWLHIGGVSYNDNLDAKQSVFNALGTFIQRVEKNGTYSRLNSRSTTTDEKPAGTKSASIDR
jgi:hypothetical protein